MKSFIVTAAAAVLGFVTFWAGALVQGHLEHVSETMHANDVNALVGVAICNRPRGLIVVHKDGSLTEVSETSAALAIARANHELPEANTAVLNLCPNTL